MENTWRKDCGTGLWRIRQNHLEDEEVDDDNHEETPGGNTAAKDC